MKEGKLNKRWLVFLSVMLIVFLLPLKQAHAGWFTDWLGGKLFDASIGQILVTFSGFIISLVGEAIAWAAGLLDSWIQWMPVSGVFFVDESWKIIRNFVNMLFILVLIVMAFGTIFNIQRYTWKDMLPKFLIAALLINFSLAIGQYIVGIANGLSSVFLTQVGTVSHAFGDGLQLPKILQAQGPNALDSAGNLVITALFGIVFLDITFLALISTAIMVLARTIVIWFLLIISPIAWFGYVLPNLRDRTWKKWWDHFLCWCFFLPYYLFFLMFAIIFIGNKDKVPLSSAATTGSILNQSLSVNTLLMYSISLAFLVGGLGMARKLACASGTYVGAAFGKIEAGVRKYAPGAAYVRGGVTGLKERAEEVKEKGVLGIGGAQRARLQEATAKGWVAGIPGPGRAPGAREEASRAQSAEVDKELKKLQQLNLNLGQLNQKLGSGNATERMAALKLKAENGWLEEKDAEVIAKTIRDAGGGRTAMGASLIQSLKKGKFHEIAKTTAKKEEIFRTFETKDLELAKAFGADMAESRELMSEEFATAILDLYKSDTEEAKKKIEESVKKNIKNFARKKEDRRNVLLNTDIDNRVRKMVAETMIDEKEIYDLRSRQTAIDLIGKGTREGLDATINIGKFNPLLNIEAKAREDKNIPLDQPLPAEVQEQVIQDLITKLQDMAAEGKEQDIKKMSKDFYRDPRFREAAAEMYGTPAEMGRLLKNAPRPMREALQGLPGTEQKQSNRKSRQNQLPEDSGGPPLPEGDDEEGEEEEGSEQKEEEGEINS